MKSLLLLLCLGTFVFAAPILAADLNGDGMDDLGDSYLNFSVASSLVVGDIAVVDTGDFTVGVFVTRLSALGYSITPIPVGSTVETLLNYSVVILPVGHGNSTNYPNFDALANDYQMYVNAGGGLWICQPNPYDMPGGQADITWAPYALTLEGIYAQGDCPVVVSDPTHCITEGLPSTIFSYPADTVLSHAGEWQILTVGPVSGSPSVMFADYGSGKVLVDLGNPGLSSICPPDDAALQRYVECLGSGTVATSETSWGSIKAYFR